VLIEATPAFPQAGFSTRKIVVPVTSDLAIRISFIRSSRALKVRETSMRRI
jgi:hypothetical protein